MMTTTTAKSSLLHPHSLHPHPTTSLPPYYIPRRSSSSSPPPAYTPRPPTPLLLRTRCLPLVILLLCVLGLSRGLIGRVKSGAEEHASYHGDLGSLVSGFGEGDGWLVIHENPLATEWVSLHPLPASPGQLSTPPDPPSPANEAVDYIHRTPLELLRSIADRSFGVVHTPWKLEALSGRRVLLLGGEEERRVLEVFGGTIPKSRISCLSLEEHTTTQLSLPLPSSEVSISLISLPIFPHSPPPPHRIIRSLEGPPVPAPAQSQDVREMGMKTEKKRRGLAYDDAWSAFWDDGMPERPAWAAGEEVGVEEKRNEEWKKEVEVGLEWASEKVVEASDRGTSGKLTVQTEDDSIHQLVIPSSPGPGSTDPTSKGAEGYDLLIVSAGFLDPSLPLDPKHPEKWVWAWEQSAMEEFRYLHTTFPDTPLVLQSLRGDNETALWRRMGIRRVVERLARDGAVVRVMDVARVMEGTGGGEEWEAAVWGEMVLQEVVRLA